MKLEMLEMSPHIPHSTTIGATPQSATQREERLRETREKYSHKWPSLLKGEGGMAAGANSNDSKDVVSFITFAP
jgi:hypothetical protein